MNRLNATPVVTTKVPIDWCDRETESSIELLLLIESLRQAFSEKFMQIQNEVKILFGCLEDAANKARDLWMCQMKQSKPEPEHQIGNLKTNTLLTADDDNKTRIHHQQKKKKNGLVLEDTLATNQVRSNPKILPKFTFGTRGARNGEFCRPWGVCTDYLNRILVADRSNHRVQVFDESGTFLWEIGKFGHEIGEFNCPSGIAVDKDLRILVVDKDNHRIQVFTTQGAFYMTFGRSGSGPGEFKYPWDIAVNEKNQIAVSDSKNHRIQLFDKRGVLLSTFGFAGNGRPNLKQLTSPRGLAFRSDGKLLVTDFNNHRIVVLNENMELSGFIGKEGDTSGCLFRPQGVACLGNFTAVSDCRNYRIQIFDDEGRPVVTFGTQGEFPGEFDRPHGIAFHPNGHLIVVDFGNDRIQVF